MMGVQDSQGSQGNSYFFLFIFYSSIQRLGVEIKNKSGKHPVNLVKSLISPDNNRHNPTIQDEEWWNNEMESNA